MTNEQDLSIDRLILSQLIPVRPSSLTTMSVKERISKYSGSSSFDTWSRSKDDDETSGSKYPVRYAKKGEPVRYVKKGEYDPDYDPVEIRRNEAEEQDAGNRTSLFSSEPGETSAYGRIRSFFQVYDDDTLHSTSLSRSPTEYTKGSSVTSQSATEYTRESSGTERSRSTQYTRDTRTSRDTSRNTGPPVNFRNAGRAVQSRETQSIDADTLGAFLDTSFETQDSNGALGPNARLSVLIEQPSMEGSPPPREVRSPNNYSSERFQRIIEEECPTIEGSTLAQEDRRTTSSSKRSRGSPQSGTYSSQRSQRTMEGSPQRTQEDLLTVLETPEKKRLDFDASLHSEDLKNQSYVSSLNGQDDPRNRSYASPSRSEDPKNRSLQSSVLEDLDESLHSAQNTKFALHDLCFEARFRDDITWRNALYLLSIQPHMANSLDKGLTPLHVSCFGSITPPEFIVRGLLVAAPETTQTADNRGRLPLHMLAATSAEPDIMQLLVDEYPQAVTEFDDKGMLPLHMLLENDTIELTIRHLRILLGQTIKDGSVGRKTKVSRRRGEHLDLSFEQVNELVSRDEQHLSRVQESSPEDIQVSFRRLYQWKKKRKKLNGGEKEGIEVSMDETRQSEGLNPAAFPAPFDQLPLHLAVARSPSRSDPEGSETEEEDEEGRIYPSGRAEILRVLIAANPSALVFADSEGRTPLLLALCGQDSLPDRDMIELLLGRSTVGFESQPKWAGDVELHKSRDNRFTNPAMISTNDTHQLPLHVVAEQMTSNFPLLAAVYEAYPAAIHIQDIRGRTPLHLALRNFQRVQLDPKALALLLTDRVAQTKDDDGVIPFDLFVGSADRLPPFEPETRSGDTSSAAVYKHFFQASVVPTTSFPRSDSVEVLQQLRKLPPWLRRYALSAGFVQDIVHEKTIQAPEVAMILLNGLTLGVLLVLFRIQMDRYSEAQESPMYANVIYCLSAYIFLFQLLLCYASIRASLFVPQCLFNFMFWVDLAGVSLAVAATTFMESDMSDTAATLGTAATGLLWMSVVGYLARWWHGMAVFVGGAARLGRMLFWPVIASAALIVGFAQMFFTLNLTTKADGCETVLGGRALCNLRDSYNTVYLLLLGTPLVDTDDPDVEELTNGTIVLIAAFTLLLVILLINIVISVVMEAARQDWEEAAVADFWESKLVFVYLTNDLFPCFSSTALDDSSRKQKKNRKVANDDSWSDNLGYLWEACMLSIFGWRQNRNSNRGNPLVAGFLRVISLIVVLIWLTLGLVTLGILWPPRVRSWLFRVRRNVSNENKLEYSAHQFAAIRNDLLQLKTMSYEKTQSVEQQVWELRQILLMAVADDEKG